MCGKGIIHRYKHALDSIDQFTIALTSAGYGATIDAYLLQTKKETFSHI